MILQSLVFLFALVFIAAFGIFLVPILLIGFIASRFTGKIQFKTAFVSGFRPSSPFENSPSAAAPDLSTPDLAEPEPILLKTEQGYELLDKETESNREPKL